jgi:hypothetical protein
MEEAVHLIKFVKLRRLIPAFAVGGVLAFSLVASVPSVLSSSQAGYGNNCGVKGTGYHDHGKVCPNRPFPGQGQGIAVAIANGSATAAGTAGTTSAGNSKAKTKTLVSNNASSTGGGNALAVGKGHGKGKALGLANGHANSNAIEAAGD